MRLVEPGLGKLLRGDARDLVESVTLGGVLRGKGSGGDGQEDARQGEGAPRATYKGVSRAEPTSGTRTESGFHLHGGERKVSALTPIRRALAVTLVGEGRELGPLIGRQAAPHAKQHNSPGLVELAPGRFDDSKAQTPKRHSPSRRDAFDAPLQPCDACMRCRRVGWVF